MNFNFIYPQNSLIKEYFKLSYSGFLNNVSYYAYPHYGIPIGFFKDATISINDKKLRITTSKKKSIQCTYSNTFYNPVKIETKGNIEEFCVFFKPFGLAQFIDKLPLTNNKISHLLFRQFDDFIALHPDLFSYSLEEKNNAFEEYLLSKFTKKKHTLYIKDAIENMLSGNHIEYEYPISPKTFYRAFKDICGVPESVLLRTIKFRQALEKIKNENPEKTMIQLTYDLGFYDQAHFNRMFKKLSAETPTSFFTNVNTISENDIYFKFD